MEAAAVARLPVAGAGVRGEHGLDGVEVGVLDAGALRAGEDGPGVVEELVGEAAVAATGALFLCC